jgi:hypothetical protein
VHLTSLTSLSSFSSHFGDFTWKADRGSAPIAPKKHRQCSRPQRTSIDVKKCQAVEHLWYSIRTCSLNPSPATVHSYVSYVFAHASFVIIECYPKLAVAENFRALVLSIAMPCDAMRCHFLKSSAAECLSSESHRHSIRHWLTR